MLSHLQEMAQLGLIDGPKSKKLVIFTFTREYEFEVPHINIGPNGWTAWMKIEIPPELPKGVNDFEIIDFNKRHLVPNMKLRKQILDWYNEIDDGITNYSRAKWLWKKALEVHNVSGRPG
jgi:hypothetical protein